MSMLNILQFLIVAIALCSHLALADNSWTWDRWPDTLFCKPQDTIDPSGLQGEGAQGCQTLAAAHQPASFSFASGGEKLDIYFSEDCHVANGHQIFINGGTCASLITGGIKAVSYKIVGVGDEVSADNLVVNYVHP